MSTYQVIFQGQILEGHDPAVVKKNIADIFGKNVQQIEPLFSGKPVVIKKDIDEQMALKYQATLLKAGARCEVKATTPGTPVPTANASEKPAQTSATTTVTKATIRAIKSGRDIVNIQVPNNFPGLSLAAPGEILGGPTPSREMRIADYSSLTLAELGTLLAEPKEIAERKPIEDFSGLTLENTDSFNRPTVE